MPVTLVEDRPGADQDDHVRCTICPPARLTWRRSGTWARQAQLSVVRCLGDVAPQLYCGKGRFDQIRLTQVAPLHGSADSRSRFMLRAAVGAVGCADMHEPPACEPGHGSHLVLVFRLE